MKRGRTRARESCCLPTETTFVIVDSDALSGAVVEKVFCPLAAKFSLEEVSTSFILNCRYLLKFPYLLQSDVSIVLSF